MSDFAVDGTNAAAPFTLKIHRGDGMCLLGMNWRDGKRPPDDFVGFAIEFHEAGNQNFHRLTNRLTFADADLSDKDIHSTLKSPIQKFRWVHFPFNAELPGAFTYRVTPVFMNPQGKLTNGQAQTADIVLARQTYPNELNVAFTRGFVSSQAFVDRFGGAAAIPKLLPATNAQGLDFVPTHPKKDEAYAWMGFEARKEILELLDDAAADKTADVCVIAYDLNLPDVVSRLEAIGDRLKIIIDNGDDKHIGTAEDKAAQRLEDAQAQVKRQHMGYLQHNKFIAVGGKVNRVVCGSTNFSWRGFYMQANNALTLRGAQAVGFFVSAFEEYWNNDVGAFKQSTSADWQTVALPSVTPKVAFSPHSTDNLKLPEIIAAIDKTTSSLLYSLAFLYQAPAHSRLVAAIQEVVDDNSRFVYGMSDQQVAGLAVRKPDGNLALVSPSALKAGIPEPFKAEAGTGHGTEMHHKFVVIDFDTNHACVYLGSHNFSNNADVNNGENLVRIQDRRVAVSYMIEGLRLFDHYHFRANQDEATKLGTPINLRKPPHAAGDLPWFDGYYSDPQKVRDRNIFS
jgi:hypothetical protein